MPTKAVTAARDLDGDVKRFSVKVLKGEFPSAKYLRIRAKDSNGIEINQPEVLKASEFEDAAPTSVLIVSHDSPLIADSSSEQTVSCGPVGMSQYFLFRLSQDKVLGLLSLLLVLQILGALAALLFTLYKYPGEVTGAAIASFTFLVTSSASLITWFIAFDKLDKS